MQRRARLAHTTPNIGEAASATKTAASQVRGTHWQHRGTCILEMRPRRKLRQTRYLKPDFSLLLSSAQKRKTRVITST